MSAASPGQLRLGLGNGDPSRAVRGSRDESSDDESSDDESSDDESSVDDSRADDSRVDDSRVRGSRVDDRNSDGGGGSVGDSSDAAPDKKAAGLSLAWDATDGQEGITFEDSAGNIDWKGDEDFSDTTRTRTSSDKSTRRSRCR